MPRHETRKGKNDGTGSKPRDGRCREWRPLTQPQHDLAASHVALALRIAKRHAQRSPWLADEFESDAGLALVRAASDYDATSKVPFDVYAGIAVQFAMGETRRANLRHAGRIDRLENVAWLAARHIAAIDAADSVDTWLQALPDRLAKVIHAIFRCERSQCDVAAELGLTQARVSQLKDSGLKLLRCIAEEP